MEYQKRAYMYSSTHSCCVCYQDNKYLNIKGCPEPPQYKKNLLQILPTIHQLFQKKE